MKKLLLNTDKKSLFLFLVLFCLNGYSQVTIKNQGFESSVADNYSYSVSSSTNVTTSTTTSMSGSRSLRFTGNNNAVFENVVIAGYSNVQVSIAFAATGVDNDEDLFIDFSYDDGANYDTTIKLVDGNSGSGGQNLAFGTGDSSPGQSSNPYTYNIPSGNDTVKIRVRSVGVDASEYYYIDNIVIRGTQIPEINLLGNSNNIASGSTTISSTINTDFGNTDVNTGLITRTYTVQNIGTSNLSIWSVYTNAGDFSASISSSTIAPGASATLTVQFNPTNAGTRNGIVSISNNDSDEGTYTFAVQGFATEQEINLQGGSPATDIPSGSTLISNTINTDFGTTAGTRTYTIQNLGTSNLNLTSAWSSNSDYSISYSPSTVTPGGTATLTVTFTPSSAGTKNATISIANNDSNEGTYSFNVSAVIAQQEINLLGNGISIPSGSTSYSTSNDTDFGNITFGAGSIVKTFTIQNTGGYTLSIWSSHDNSGDFSVSHSASTIAPGGTATLTVTFTPTSIGVKTATITIDNNDSNEGTYTFNVTANSISPNPEINVISNGNTIPDGTNTHSTANNTEYGNTYLGVTVSRTFTIQNTGTTNLNISSATIAGANPSEFTITTPPSATIAPGASSDIIIRYNASFTGNNITAQVLIYSNDADEATYNFNIRGTTINPEIDILGNGVSISNGDTSPSTADWTNFGEIDTTIGTITRTFSITNQGTTNLIISNPTISGTHAADFTVTTNPSSTTIGVGVTRTFVVTFNPSASGTRNAIVTVTNNDSDENPYTFHITGFGSNSEINVTGNATSIVDGDTTPSTTDGTDFGNTDITFETKTQTFVIQNTGTTNLNIDIPTITGTHAADFSITTNPGTLSIAPGSSTSFVVTFNPSGTSTRTATLNITNNDGNENPYNFTIRGNGTDVEIDVQGNTTSIANGDSTPSLTDHTDFGSTDINTGTIARIFTIANMGTTSMTISNPTISGANASDFTITANPSGTTFNGGTSRTFTITFNPSASGTRTALVTINNSDFNENPYTFAIQGYGTDVEINITGLGNSIVNGDTTPTTTDGTDFGNILLPSGTSSSTFVIQNLGTTTLTISNPVISGINAADFTITSNPSTLSIPAGGSTSFVVQFATNTLGRRNAMISITNDDVNENPYAFFIHGYGDIDSDGDGISNNVDTDDDNDGITDIIECSTCLSDPFQNGSFESPVIAASSYAILPTNNVPGWQTSAENFIEIWSSGFNGVPSAAGNQFAELNANIPGILYQTFCLNGSGGTINWSIKHRGRGGVDQAFVKFGPTLAGAIASTPIVTMVDGNTAWGTYSGVYNIPVGQNQIVLTFQAGYTGSGSASVGNFIDDVQIVINQNCVDSDGDGIADIIDVDDDNDGIPDIEEAGFKAYSNNKSTMDMTSASTWVDTNGNGMNDYIDAMISGGTYTIPNTDGDARPDYLDLDSDNDSIFDVDEAGLLNGDGDINGDGIGDLLDSDGDGLLDLYDNSPVFGTTFRAYAQDTDADNIPDYKELDSNADGTFDIAGTLYANLDANNDGLIDSTLDNDKDGIMDSFDTNTIKRGSPRDLNRKLYLDFDGRNDYAEDSQILSGLASATLMAWIDLNSTFSANGVVIGQDKFNIRVLNNRRIRATVNGKTLDYTTSLDISRWYHVAAVLGSGQLKIYVNGTLVAARALNETIQADTTKLTLGKNPIALNTFFKGKIDEVRVFNAELSLDQIKRIVHQEIENNSGEVRGTVISQNIGSLPFNRLLRYYRMDTFKDDIIDDLSTPAIDLVTGMKMYNHKVINYQEAPMPFVTRQAGTFATAINDSSKDIRGLDVIENDASIVIVNHNITENGNNTDIGMIINSGVTVKMNNDTKIQNDWYLKLDGKIDLAGKSQLVQTAESTLDATSAGSIERDQQGQSSKFNYNYWSSPVSSINNTTVNHGYTVAGVMKDGTNPDDIKNIQWTTGINSTATSPITLSSYWIFKFQNLGNDYYNWASVGQNGTLLPGQGFTLKGSNASSPNQNYTFLGKPNNGTITSTIGANNLLLAGNPYPSAIDANQFIDDNIAAIDGTLYFWEHYSTNNSHNTAAYQGGYATYTKTGGTAPVAPALVSGLGSSSKTPTRFIPVGQGFFVNGSTTGGTIRFENGQRLFIKEDNASSFTLFRANNSATAASPSNNNSEDSITEGEEFMKIRLGFNSANNYHRQILLGFMNDHATANYDPGYDGISMDQLTNDMYFINGNLKLNIQGEGHFNVNNIYPLGVKNAVAGNVKFVIDNKENFTNDQNVFIHDNVTNTYHNINQNPFVINLPAGTIENRFSLRFTENGSLNTDENNLETGFVVFFNNQENTINIKNQLLETNAKSVQLFNILGQHIQSWEVEELDQTNIVLPTKSVSTGTYIVKITTDNGSLSKKIIIK